MVRVEGDVVIHRPVEAVFDVVADERNEPAYNPRMRRAEQITAGCIGVGTRFRAETASLGRPVAMTIEYTAFERPRRLGSVTRLAAMDIRGALAFEPVPEGTILRWSWELAPRGPFRLATPLIARLGRRQEAASWAGLKRYLEGPAPSAAAQEGGRRTAANGDGLVHAESNCLDGQVAAGDSG